MTADLTLEDIAIHEGLDYKLSSGSRGEQINFRECVHPSCDSEKWKVYANAEQGLGNCFSCGNNFNLFKFCGWLLERRGQPHDNRSIGLYLNAVRKALGYRPRAKARPPVTVAVETPLILPESTPLPYQDGWNHPYLEGRGINGDYAKRFHLRYSVFGSNTYRNEKGEEVRQSFAERIIIPVFDLDGVLVTYQGRDTTGISDQKYKFAGGLPGTGRYLYNGHVAQALKARSVLMNEGPTDVIGSQKALDSSTDLRGIAPVGSFGKKLSKQKEGADQVGAFLKLKGSGLQEVIIMWDAEPEAYESALEAASLLMKIGLAVKIALLPAGQDPGEADAHTICQAIREARPVNRISMLRLKMTNPYQAA